MIRHISITCPATGEKGEAFLDTSVERHDVDPNLLLPALGWGRIRFAVMVPKAVTPTLFPQKALDALRPLVDAIAEQMGVESDSLVDPLIAGYNSGNAIKNLENAGRNEMVFVETPPLSPAAVQAVFQFLQSLGVNIPDEVLS